jgi:hypothetical protein
MGMAAITLPCLMRRGSDAGERSLEICHVLLDSTKYLVQMKGGSFENCSGSRYIPRDCDMAYYLTTNFSELMSKYLAGIRYHR